MDSRNEQESRKKEYRSPELKEYGALKDLTTGGSGNASEGSMGQKPRP
jgi:hypothetical protein